MDLSLKSMPFFIGSILYNKTRCMFELILIIRGGLVLATMVIMIFIPKITGKFFPRITKKGTAKRSPFFFVIPHYFNQRICSGHARRAHRTFKIHRKVVSSGKGTRKGSPLYKCHILCNGRFVNRPYRIVHQKVEIFLHLWLSICTLLFPKPSQPQPVTDHGYRTHGHGRSGYHRA